MKDQKRITFTSLTSLTINSTSYPMVIKEIPSKCSTCKTSAGIEFYKRNPFNFFLRSPSIFKRNPIKKNRLQFYMKNPM